MLNNSQSPFQEDWQLSQFWYDEATCEAFGKIIRAELKRRNLLETGKVVFISSPTAFKYMMAKKVLPGLFSSRNSCLFYYYNKYVENLSSGADAFAGV